MSRAGARRKRGEMAEVAVIGRSDDLIELSGDMECEFSAKSEGPTFLAFPSGDVLKIEYTGPDGVWRIVPEAKGSARVVHTTCEALQQVDPSAYSDLAVVSGDFDASKIDVWGVWPPTRAAVENAVEVYLDINGIADLDDERMAKLYELLHGTPVPGAK